MMMRRPWRCDPGAPRAPAAARAAARAPPGPPITITVTISITTVIVNLLLALLLLLITAVLRPASAKGLRAPRTAAPIHIYIYI